jgi:hypothetical protein
LPKFLTLLYLKSRGEQVTICFKKVKITGIAFAYYIIDSLLITGIRTCPMASQVPDQLQTMRSKKRKKQNGQYMPRPRQFSEAGRWIRTEEGSGNNNNYDNNNK